MDNKIKVPHPKWESELLRVLMELEKLRQPILYMRVPPYIFFQLKGIFQTLETLGSARIEGNKTTLTEYVEKLIEDKISKEERDQELSNIEKGINFIEENTNETTPINKAYLSQLHRILTKNLTPPPSGEGSKHPGELRKSDVTIQGIKPPPPVSLGLLQSSFDDFLTLINTENLPQNQLLMVAIAHHRFMYIHPFDNGNGRIGRLLNYALLIKLGFNVQGAGRILNPSSVFYTDRNVYYNMLSQADSLKDKDLLAWSEYFLNGLKNQLEKIDQLMDIEFTKNQILLPTLKHALDRHNITKEEFNVLTLIVKKDNMAIQSAELNKIGITETQKKTYIMRKLREKGMAIPIQKNARTYTIKFTNNYLLRSVIRVLEEKGFIADFLNRNT